MSHNTHQHNAWLTENVTDRCYLCVTTRASQPKSTNNIEFIRVRRSWTGAQTSRDSLLGFCLSLG